jgi:hypothetical protein
LVRCGIDLFLAKSRDWKHYNSEHSPHRIEILDLLNALLFYKASELVANEQILLCNSLDSQYILLIIRYMLLFWYCNKRYDNNYPKNTLLVRDNHREIARVAMPRAGVNSNTNKYRNKSRMSNSTNRPNN